MNPPVFLVGAERSGTTLLRLMLDSHPDISMIEEFEYVTDLVGDDGSYPDMARYGRYLETNRIFNGSGFTFRDDVGYRELVDGFLRERQQQAGAGIAGATIHFGFAKALKLWPDAKLIHILRDPRDVGPSVIAMGWAGNLWWALNKWIEAEQEWDRVAPTLPDDRKLTIRYADLVGDHVGTLTRICRFAGTEYTDEMLAYAEQTDYDLPDPTKASGWRRKLSASEVQLAEAKIGLDWLQAKGFEPSGHPPITVGRLRREWLRWHDRKGKLQVRVDVYGLRFTAADLLARALGNERWQRSLRLEAAEVQKTRLRRSWVESGSG